MRQVPAWKWSTCCRTSRSYSALTSSFWTIAKPATLPQYSFIEPNYTDHEDEGGEQIASDQHPDHDVQQGEVFIATVYNAIRQNPELWKTTALLVVYDEHGGIYDHVPPPACRRTDFRPPPIRPEYRG